MFNIRFFKFLEGQKFFSACQKLGFPKSKEPPSLTPSDEATPAGVCMRSTAAGGSQTGDELSVKLTEGENGLLSVHLFADFNIKQAVFPVNSSDHSSAAFSLSPPKTSFLSPPPSERGKVELVL